MPVVAIVIVGASLLLVAGLFVWSNLRSARHGRLRPPPRPATCVPEGLQPWPREPDALRSAFVLTARGEVLTAAQPLVGEWRGEELSVIDLVIRHTVGAQPQALTVVTLDVDWRWPWMRLHHRDLEVTDVPELGVDLDDALGAAALPWCLAAADADLAGDLVTSDLLAWLARFDAPLLLETTPRHLLLAAPLVDDASLADLVEIAKGIVDHVSKDVRARIAAPHPADDF